MNAAANLAYRIGAPIARWWLGNRLIHKPIQKTSFSLYYNPAQHLGFLFQREIRYERAFIDTVLDFIKPGHVVFEIGSNIGQYSLLIADKIGATGKLVCVEPDSDNFAFLTFNVLKNKLHNVELLNLAVSDHEGRLEFFKDTITGGRSGSLVKQFTRHHFQGKTESVQVTTFESLIQQYGTPDFVKVDVEGAEVMIFKPVPQLPKATTYFIEVRTETAGEIFEIFQNQGFHIFSLTNRMREIQSVADAIGFDNWIIHS